MEILVWIVGHSFASDLFELAMHDNGAPIIQQVAFALFFGGWLLLSIICQFRGSATQAIRRFDIFSLVPRWTFFAPNPGRHDSHLVYRDRQSDGRLTTWTEIPTIPERSWLSAFWNPDKREKKALHDAITAMQRWPKATPEDQSVMLSLPYLLVLNYVVNRVDRGSGAVMRQFAIARTSGFHDQGPPAPIVRSAFHRLRAQVEVKDVA